ncbi:gluconokinase [Zunongwangia endophytica]|uniref:Gluconokinase n=1 Tax=Zunongwangia endophytica TaxID=1808945 RepID=A0ABV8HH68_9FLAO|nr:gluconokinase [Zunongwangia endophytica]MDN3594113.1 gluconokinase [Zunongwangia endophytica]
MKVYIVMGVSGSGKTTIGREIASKLEIPFFDADDYHPKANVEKMKNGIALDDEDRKSWLKSLAENIEKWKEDKGAVLACSALKKKYRATLSHNLKDYVVFVYLYAEYELIYERMMSRKGHYFKPELLKSQFDTLEEPENAIKVGVDQRISETVAEVISKIKSEKTSTS